MKNLAQTKVGKIVAENFRTSKVFTAHGIDFCCKGGITLEEACLQRNLQVDEIIRELKESFKTPDGRDHEHQDVRDLIRTIVEVHHKYVTNTIPALRLYLDKLSQVHGERHPELIGITQLFSDAADALAIHMQKEEQILFPYIIAMAEAQENTFPLSRPHFGDIAGPIEVMEHEHETEGDRFREISRLSHEYTCPPDGCQTYQVTYALLREFEKDLHQHIHLENNILFPRATEMFKAFKF